MQHGNLRTRHGRASHGTLTALHDSAVKVWFHSVSPQPWSIGEAFSLSKLKRWNTSQTSFLSWGQKRHPTLLDLVGDLIEMDPDAGLRLAHPVAHF